MAIFESDNFGKTILSPQSAGEVMVCDDVVELPITLDADDIAKVGHLPAGCVPLDVIVVVFIMVLCLPVVESTRALTHLSLQGASSNARQYAAMIVLVASRLSSGSQRTPSPRWLLSAKRS